jgi:hypothetical protein
MLKFNLKVCIIQNYLLIISFLYFLINKIYEVKIGGFCELFLMTFRNEDI